MRSPQASAESLSSSPYQVLSGLLGCDQRSIRDIDQIIRRGVGSSIPTPTLTVTGGES